MLCSSSIFVIGGATGLATPVMAQEEPITEQGYEREELGVNAYTAPLIARIFQHSMSSGRCLSGNCKENFQKRVLAAASEKLRSLEDWWPTDF